MKNNKYILVLILLISQISFSQITEELDKLYINYSKTPGISVSIIKNGENIYSNNFGYANLDYDVKITENTVFDIASLSKQFTAACIFLLENQGKLNLEDPIQKYLPDFPIYKEGKIKIKHLLHQTSGLRDYLRLIHAKGQTWDNDFGNKKNIEILKSQKELNYKPGTKFLYNNSNYMLLSTIVEKISKQTFAEFIEENIFNPLEMNNTFVYNDAYKVIKNRAIGYHNVDGNFKRLHYFNSTTTGDDNVYTTIKDLLKWNKNFKSSKIGGRNFINKMLQTGTLNNGNSINYAGGLFIENIYGFETISHTGYWSGFRSLLFKIPSLDFTVILLSNNANTSVRYHLDQIVNIVLRDEISQQEENITTEHKSIKLNAKKLNKFKGDYFNYLEGNSKEILVKNDTLIYKRANGRETKLIPINKNKFMFFGAPQVVLDFNTKNEMRFVIANVETFLYKKYNPKTYTTSELNSFSGNFYSKELDTQYDIKATKNNTLCISINDIDYFCIKPEAENIFKDIEEHSGYLKFFKNKIGHVASFTINDEMAKNIEFVRIKS